MDVKNNYWQVFFLPKDDVVNPHSYIAFCPFTGVIAEGASEREAAIKWQRKATRKLHSHFFLPWSLLTTRKVWYGESDTAAAPVYLLDHYFTNTEATAICPLTKQVIGGSVQSIKEEGSLPQTWCDWKISCTPLLQRSTFYSLTPNCINY